MEKIIINGGRPLNGTIEVSGAKNAALPILFACLLVDDVCVIENIPNISDVSLSLEILSSMGCRVRTVSKNTVEIDSRYAKGGTSPYELVRRMRGSYYLIGAELGRFGRAYVGMPGGCNFGVRPIDQHIKGFKALGAKVVEGSGHVEATCEKLVGTSVYFDTVTVGGTINVMIAACCAKGMTVLENAAREPHIVDLANFLNTCGAKISGAGTDVIKIKGVERLHGCTYAIIPDMIEAGTYMVAAAAAGGDLTVANVIPKHLESISAKLEEMGVEVIENDDSVEIIRSAGELRRINLKTLPYPGFPTDMNPQISVLLCLAKGVSHLTEGIYDNRFRYVEELRRMGANIKVEGATAVIEGGDALSAAPVKAVDLRAGVAMVIAGLCAKGRTEIDEIHYIERGYDDLVGKLHSVGADIRKVYVPDPVLFDKAN